MKHAAPRAPAIVPPDATVIARFRADLASLLDTPDGPVALAVSGGPDSLALLLLAQAVLPGRVCAATVDHGLRPEAAAEATLVASICAALGVPHVALTIAVRPCGEGLQAAARTARYAALAEWAEGAGAQNLATAHHADDQAETLLLRLARGAGLTGLAGVRARRPLTPGGALRLVRPLLGWRKAELEAIVAAAGIAPADDPSNGDPRFDRTRAREMLGSGWPDAISVAASAHHLAEAEEALEWSAVHLLAARLTGASGALELDPFGLPRELLRRLFIAALLRAGHDGAPRGPSVDRALAALRAGDSVTLGGILCRGGDRWCFQDAPPRLSG